MASTDPATLAEVIAVIPAVAAVPVDLAQAILDDATAQCDPAQYGERTNFATICLTGHGLSMIGALAGVGIGGQVQSISIGSISKTWAVAAVADTSGLASSGWGRMFLQIYEAIPGRPLVA